MTAGNDSTNNHEQVIPVATCKNPYLYPAPLYRVARVDFTAENNPVVVLECLVTGEQYASDLEQLCLDTHFIKYIEPESSYRLGFMKGLQVAGASMRLV